MTDEKRLKKKREKRQSNEEGTPGRCRSQRGEEERTVAYNRDPQRGRSGHG